MSVNPFTEGSKRYKIAEKILKGDSKDKIVKDLKLKSKHVIYAVNSAWKKIKAKAEAEKEKKIPVDTGENHVPLQDPPIQPQNPIFPSQISKSVPPQFPAIPPRIGAQQGTIVQIEGFAPGKTINLTPPNITMIQWFMNKYKWKGDLSDFLNQTVEDFFRARNWRIKIVQEENLL